jgi:hypothetical protein
LGVLFRGELARRSVVLTLYTSHNVEHRYPYISKRMRKYSVYGFHVRCSSSQCFSHI